MSNALTQDDAHALLIQANFLEHGSSFIKTAGRVATVMNVAISVNPLEPTQHKMPHFHARFNSDEEAVYAIETGDCLAGQLKPACHKAVKAWQASRVEALMKAWKTAQDGRQPRKIAAAIKEVLDVADASDEAPARTRDGVGQLVTMEVDVFVNRIRKIALEQGLGSKSEIAVVCDHVSDQIYDLGKQLCESARGVIRDAKSSVEAGGNDKC